MRAVFKRYNTVDEHDLRQAMRQMDTYMDTTKDTGQEDTAQTIEKTGMGR